MQNKFVLCDLSLYDRDHLITDRFVSYENTSDFHWNNNYIHKPISFHAYAAAMKGRFVSAPLDDWNQHVKWADTIVFTICYNCKIAKNIIEKTKALGKKVLVAFHESGDRLQFLFKNDPQWIIDFRDACNAADYVLAYYKPNIMIPFYEGIGISIEKIVSDVPQPMVLEMRDKFLVPEEKKNGLFVGGRLKFAELEKRNWIYSFAIAIKFAKRKNIKRIVTQNGTQIKNETLLNVLQQLAGDEIKVELYGDLPFEEYLHLLASCQHVINFDGGDVSGQLEYDALFVDTIPEDVLSGINYTSTAFDQWKQYGNRIKFEILTEDEINSTRINQPLVPLDFLQQFHSHEAFNNFINGLQ